MILWGELTSQSGGDISWAALWAKIKTDQRNVKLKHVQLQTVAAFLPFSCRKPTDRCKRSLFSLSTVKSD